MDSISTPFVLAPAERFNGTTVDDGVLPFKPTIQQWIASGAAVLVVALITLGFVVAGMWWPTVLAGPLAARAIWDLRPQVQVTRTDLLVRNRLRTRTIPLNSISDLRLQSEEPWRWKPIYLKPTGVTVPWQCPTVRTQSGDTTYLQVLASPKTPGVESMAERRLGTLARWVSATEANSA